MYSFLHPSRPPVTQDEAANLMSFVESVTRKNRHLVTELAESQRAAEDLFASNVRLQGAQTALQVRAARGEPGVPIAVPCPTYPLPPSTHTRTPELCTLHAAVRRLWAHSCLSRSTPLAPMPAPAPVPCPCPRPCAGAHRALSSTS